LVDKTPQLFFTFSKDLLGTVLDGGSGGAESFLCAEREPHDVAPATQGKQIIRRRPNTAGLHRN
jgi:hypothetical protein